MQKSASPTEQAPDAACLSHVGKRDISDNCNHATSWFFEWPKMECAVDVPAPEIVFLPGIERHQRVNQFPRSYEITRKDTLCRNINCMKAIHGERNYGFIPNGWVLPSESEIFERFFHQNGGCYIVKPAALSCGRGIYVTDDINDIELHGLDENVSVSQYISNPLLIDGYKFDQNVRRYHKL